MKIYVIWGIPPNRRDETPLIEQFEGKDITDKDIAAGIAKVLEGKYKCTQVRIQEIDLTDNKIFV